MKHWIRAKTKDGAPIYLPMRLMPVKGTGRKTCAVLYDGKWIELRGQAETIVNLIEQNVSGGGKAGEGKKVVHYADAVRGPAQ